MGTVLSSWAQAWSKKAAQAVFTLKTFKSDGTLLGSANGVFVSENGEAVSCFTPFRGADRAVVIDAQGKEWQQIDQWQYTYFPMPLDACDLCADRTAKGKLPSCVHHCQAQCLVFGEVEELAKELAKKPKQALFCLG